MQSVLNAVEHYLRQTLGVESPPFKPWARADELPYFLRAVFRFSEIELLNQPFVLAIVHEDGQRSLGEVSKWLGKVSDAAGYPAILVANALASYDRRRLIQQKVPFIVPGNQLYLPHLGLDLREYFRKATAVAQEALSPSAQALLIRALLRAPSTRDWSPSADAIALGYTPMTLSRAVKELTATGLATRHTAGRQRLLQMSFPPQQAWAHAKPFLRTPVKRTVWARANELAASATSRLAGLSALAQYSLLNEPPWPVYAIMAADWKAATSAGVQELPGPETDAQQWQLWSYRPNLLSDTNTVDPLSLQLSLQADPDDRVQIALDSLKEQLPW